MNDRTTVLVTGSDGFLGRHLVPYLAVQGYRVIAASRTASAFEKSPNIAMVPLPDLSRPFDWQPLLQHCGAVVHLAGIAHRAPWLIAIPERWLELLLKAIGKDTIWQRIGCPPIARPTKLLALGWKPS